MLTITNREGYANHNHNDILLYSCKNGYYLKSQQITSKDKNVEEKETLLHFEREYRLLQPPWKIVWKFFKIKNGTTIGSKNSTSGYFLKKNASLRRYKHPALLCSIVYNIVYNGVYKLHCL